MRHCFPARKTRSVRSTICNGSGKAFCLSFFNCTGKEAAVLEQRALAVRTLVEFTLHGEDITRGTDIRSMQDGMLGHKARQAALSKGWQSEVPLKAEIVLEDLALTLVLSGRMDAFLDGVIPAVEEIKLWQGKDPPDAPYPAHRAQALCYAWMLFRDRPETEEIRIQVVYVSRTGKVRGVFSESLTPPMCDRAFHELLDPYVQRLRSVDRHRKMRNSLIESLPFPFPAYRPGQRAYAVQVYTAISRRRRLFASMPTGTGKSAATLFPAIKGMPRGLVSQIFYLTARTTQRKGPLDALSHMPSLSDFWVLELDAKERQCPEQMICHPDFCPRARGHFLRDTEAIEEMLSCSLWTKEQIRRIADKHMLCPFEFSLSLCVLADLVICDYNYVFDPAVHLQRIFDASHDVTLLIDEAHHLLPRIRDMLSGQIDGLALRKLRRRLGKTAGRSHPLYKAMTRLMNELDLLALKGIPGGTLSGIPESVYAAVLDVTDALLESEKEHLDWEEDRNALQDLLSDLLSFSRVSQRSAEDYAFLIRRIRDPLVQARCLNPASHFASVTRGMQGTVCFSATLDPLDDMKLLLGGDEEDACFSAPSPFPPENLLIVQADLNVRYAAREQSVKSIAQMIRTMVNAHDGRYMVFFPSFAFLQMTEKDLSLPCQVQKPSMTAQERDDFLRPYLSGDEPVLSLCVLGGIFSEGIDLPGRCLDGVMVVGVGLPQVGPEQEALKAWYDAHLGHGFLYAYQIPGMQKAAQAAGRVIRSEYDRGIVILVDDRFRQSTYRRLLPPHWHPVSGSLSSLLSSFWDSSASPSPEEDS